MSYQFTELAKPLVSIATYRGNVEAEAKKVTSIINQKLDSGWTVYSTHTMTVGKVGYIVYVLRRPNKET